MIPQENVGNFILLNRVFFFIHNEKYSLYKAIKFAKSYLQMSLLVI